MHGYDVHQALYINCEFNGSGPKTGPEYLYSEKGIKYSLFLFSTPMKYSIYIVDSSELVMVVDPKAGPVWSYSEHAIKFE